MTLSNKKELNEQQSEEIIQKLKARFENNRKRHPNINWEQVEGRLRSSKRKLASVYEMEKTGGEPDVIEYASNTNEYIFCDCSPESPSGRRNLCYDRAAQEARKEDSRPTGNVLDMAAAMGIELLTEEQYRRVQVNETFDTKTSSWVETPSKIRKLGGALFCDRRYQTVFVYHNGAQSYYASRGFRGILRV